MSHVSLASSAVPNWHRLDVCSSDAMARTSVSVIGALDSAAVDEIDDAVMSAEVSQHALVLDLRQLSSVTPQAMRDLLTRGRLPRVTIAG
jgi:hypothetical protein